MGLGKTVQSIQALNELVLEQEEDGRVWHVLIVCPKSVLGVWQSELSQWMTVPYTLQTLTSSKTQQQQQQDQEHTSSSAGSTSVSITLINYDLCHKYKTRIQTPNGHVHAVTKKKNKKKTKTNKRSTNEQDKDVEIDHDDFDEQVPITGASKATCYDVLICDEAHYLKSRTSQRTKAILGNDSSQYPGIASRYLWLLTGTPMMNRPEELYPLLSAIARETATQPTTSDPVSQPLLSSSSPWPSHASSHPSNNRRTKQVFEFSESFTAFTERYCDPKQVMGRSSQGKPFVRMDTSGSSNLSELRDRMQPIMLRRHKENVLRQLPPKVRSCVLLLPTSTTTTTTTTSSLSTTGHGERQRIRALLGLEHETPFAVPKATADGALEEDFDLQDEKEEEEEEEERNPTNLQEFGSLADHHLLSYLESHLGVSASCLQNYTVSDDESDHREVSDQGLMGILARVRRETALQKLEPAVELLEHTLTEARESADGNNKEQNPSPKVVVFCHHIHLIEGLMKYFGPERAVCVRGGMSLEDRMESVQRFQNDPHVSVFVGGIRAAGVGLTLTAASRVVFLELDWSPGVMVQAEDRCHRVGQPHCVQVQYYVFPNTLDEWLAKTLVSKQAQIQHIFQPLQSPKDEQPHRRPEHYVFDFGKHRGLPLEDVPVDYIQFVVKNPNIWKGRPALWRALLDRGFVNEHPPETRPHPVSLSLPLRPNMAQYYDKQQSQSRMRSQSHSQQQHHRTVPSRPSDRSLAADYVFDFGKHTGLKWQEVPLSYREWILRQRVWVNRPNLREALRQMGYKDIPKDTMPSTSSSQPTHRSSAPSSPYPSSSTGDIQNDDNSGQFYDDSLQSNHGNYYDESDYYE